MNSRILIFYLITLCLVACKTNEKSIQRAADPWVMRSVLDLKPRMISLALHPRGMVAYDAQACLPYKVWEGGIHWDGAAYNNMKTIQPASWGNTYWRPNVDTLHWRWESQGKSKRLSPRFEGYTINQNRIKFVYKLDLGNGDSIEIQEQPEFFLNEEGMAVFQQSFKTKATTRVGQLFFGSNKVVSNGITEINREFPLFDSLHMKPRLISTNNNQNWLDRSGCNTCHEMEIATIGPGYKQIAERYAATTENRTYLVKKVKEGGSGIWGEIAMQAHPHLLENDIAKMVNYILSLAPGPQKTPKNSPKPIIHSVSKTPGFGVALEGIHPAFDLETIRPQWFKPRVGGMDFHPDGRLLISTWDSIGAVYALQNVETGDTNKIEVKRIAEGLHEPLGVKVVGEEIFVMQKPELTQLIDHDGDGITDEYKSICNSFGVTADFHEYAYGLAYKDDHFYANLGLAMRLMSTELQHPDRGTTIKISKDGSFSKVLVGLRQANGIDIGPSKDLFISENQGRWVPACKLIAVQTGEFHGCLNGSGDRFDGLQAAPPAVWLPQNEIGNSPGQPLHIPSGIYKDQLLLAEVTHGGIKRIFVEKVNGKWQGVVFRFTQGLEAGINRMAWGPDSALYVGGVGMNGNWGWKGKQFGLQKLVPNENIAFEMLKVEVTPQGLDITFTEAIEESIITKDDIFIRQWRYEATSNYGGPKLDLEELEISALSYSPDRKQLRLTVPERKKGHVIYIRLNEKIRSETGKNLWAGEAWYTLNEIPSE